MKLDVTFAEKNETLAAPNAETAQSFPSDFGEVTTLHDGQNGATFTPHVSDDGVLSWSNDRELTNPTPVNIRGKDGYTPVKGVDYFDGAPGANGYTPVKGVDYFDGQPGKDGVSPTVTTSKSGKVTTITIKDASGTKTATVSDGVDGKTPVKGIDYFDGAKGDPGYTPVKGVDYFDGAKGEPGYTPQKGKDYFDGAKGDPGYTPVRGTDYWTAADKAEMVQDVLAALPVYNGEVADV